MRAGKVSDSDNLNVFTETGWYEIPTSGQATLDKNYPINKTGGILYVHTSGAGTLQVYYAYTGDSNYVKICTCHYFKTTGFWSNWDIYIRTSDLNWQYAAWTRLAGGGAGTYVSTYYSPYMILVRGSFNAQMSSLNHIAWYDAGLYYYPFAKINQNLWNLKAEAPPSQPSTQYLGHIITIRSSAANGAPNGTSYAAVWTWWDGQFTNIGLLRQSTTLTDWECNSFTLMSKSVTKA